VGSGTAQAQQGSLRRVVTDAGPLIHLAEAGALHLLELVGEVHAPRAVDGEAAVHFPEWEAVRPSWLSLTDLAASAAATAAAWVQAGLLDAGEAAALA
jgi:hypothetical protein